MPVVFFGHGSPMAAIETTETSRAWRSLAADLPKPRAILSLSAHWVTRGTGVTAMERPRTIHDFGQGFPRALFEVRYPAPGDPALAQRVAELLVPTPVALDPGQWGLDHGTWSVLVHAYPDADIPVVQLSLDAGLTSQARFEVGRRLAPLRDEGVLIVGTGNIVHNLRTMNWSDPAAAPFDWAVRFNDAIRTAIVEDQPERVLGFAGMGQDAALSAPTPEHLWPLFYILGARAPGETAQLFNDRLENGSISMTSVVFGQESAALAA